MSDCNTCNNCYVSIISGDICVIDYEMGTKNCEGYNDDVEDVFDLYDKYYEEKAALEDLETEDSYW